MQRPKAPPPFGLVQVVGFDRDDALWRSQEFYGRAQADFEAIVGRSVDLAAGGLRALGGWGVYMPYHATWEHELLQDSDRAARVVEVQGPGGIVEAIERMLTAPAPRMAHPAEPLVHAIGTRGSD